MSNDRLTLRYVPLSTLALWDRNPKLHSLDQLRESIQRYGFRDPPAFDPSLNEGRGGVVEGNGRAQVLTSMEEAGDPPPRGIACDEDGQWCVPVLFGVDARSRAEAEAYGVDHNALTLGGSGLGFEDLVQLFDEEALQALLRDTPDVTSLLVSLGGADVDALLEGPSYEPVSAEEQSRLDEKKRVTCPDCGKEFRP